MTRSLTVAPVATTPSAPMGRHGGAATAGRGPSGRTKGQPKDTFWTPERAAAFDKLKTQGLSHAEIARAVGCSRSASIGRSRRLGLSIAQDAFRWTPEAIAKLRAGYAAGTPTDDIAADVGAPRQACIRKASKLHLKHTFRNGHRALKAEAPKPTPVRTAPRPIDPAGVWQDRPRSVSLLDLRMKHCRWPLGPSPFRYCGCDRVPGKAYCAEHLAIATSPGSLAERRAGKLPREAA